MLSLSVFCAVYSVLYASGFFLRIVSNKWPIELRGDRRWPEPCLSFVRVEWSPIIYKKWIEYDFQTINSDKKTKIGN